MSSIIFAIADSISHYNASYKIARGLKENGHNIIYIADSKKREKEVVAQGFQFITIYEGFSKSFNEIAKSKLNKISKYFKRMKNLKAYQKELVEGTEVEKLIETIKPELFVIDVFHILHAVLVARFDVKTILLQTYVATDKHPNIPPLNSGLIPDGTAKNKFLIEVAWAKLFIHRFFINWFHKLFYFGLDKNSLMKKVMRRSNLASKALDSKRCFHPGLKDIPELVLCAKEFDFPRNDKKDQFFVGPMVEMNRNDVLYDEKYLDYMLQSEINMMSGKKHKPLIYCSLGTLNLDWYNNCESFFKLLIEVFVNRPEYELILSVGPDIPLKRFSNVPENVNIFQLVPQIDILEKASIMITHGGINSINECILSQVPMLVYPLSSNIDQNGNAARIEYHRLGLRGNIQKETSSGIMEKIDQLIEDQNYKQNIDNMNEVYLSYSNSNKAIDIIESYLYSNNDLADKSKYKAVGKKRSLTEVSYWSFIY